MEIINNAYRILKTENINRYFNTYLVQNISDTDRLGRMYILNLDTFPQETLNFLTNEYYSYVTRQNDHLMTVRDFGTVHTIDMRAVERKAYFLLVEQEEETENLLDRILTTEDSDQLLEYMMEILRIFDLTTRKEIRYPYLDGQSFYVTNTGQIKLKNTAVIHLERLMDLKVDGDILYISPECFRGRPATVKSEIYAVGVYLENFFKNKKFIAQYRKQLNKIIQKMKSYYENQRYDSFLEVIADVNEGLGTDFPAVFEKKSIYFKEELILGERGGLIGQKTYCDKIFEKVEMFNKGLDGFFLYEILGDFGTGKTVFISYMAYVLSVGGLNVFTDSDKNELSKRRSIEYILVRIMEEKGITNIKKYPRVEELLRGGGMIEDESSMVAQIGEFISEVIGNESTCFLMDNVQLSDSITLGVIDYLNHYIDQSQRLMIIYSAEKSLDLKKTASFSMKSLNLEETGYFIRRMIGMHYSSEIFFMKVYEETQGNIGKIKEVITEMYHQKMLYMENDGRWVIRVDTYDKLIFPYKKENDIAGFLRSITDVQREMILEMALLKNSYTASEFQQISETDLSEKEIEENFDDLGQTGFIALRFGDFGYHYDFKDSYVKRKLYELIDEEERQKRHRKVVERLLTINKTGTKVNYLSELIYQLRKIKSYLKASFYAGKLSKIFLKREQRNDAITMAKEAVECAQLAKDNRRLLAACFRYARVLGREYRLQEAIQYYEECIAIADRLGRHETEAACLLGLSEIYVLLNDFGKSDHCLEQVDKLPQSQSQRSMQLRYLIALSENRIQSDRYDDMEDIVDQIGRILEKESEDLKGEYYTIKGIWLSEQGNIDAAESYQKKGIEILVQTDNYKWICSAYNNMGVFYDAYRKNYESAIYYYRKMIEVSERYHVPNARVVGYFNLGEGMLFKYQIEQAQRYFELSLKESIRIGKQNITFCNYILLADVMFWLLDILAAKNYLEKAEHELTRYPFQGRAIYSYYKLKARFHLFNGDSKKAKSFIQKAVWEANGIEKSEIAIIQAYTNIFLAQDDSVDKHIRSLIEEIRSMSVYPAFVVKAFLLLCFVKRTKYENDVLELIYWLGEHARLEEGSLAYELVRQIQIFYSGGEFVLKEDLNGATTKQGYLYMLYLSFFYYMDRELYFQAINTIVKLYVILRNVMKASRMEMRFDNHMGLVMHRLIDFIEDISAAKSPEELKEVTSRELGFTPTNSKTFYQSRFGDNRILHHLSENPLVQKIIREGLGIRKSDIDTEELIAKLKCSNLKNIEHILEYILKLSWASAAAIITKQNKKYVKVVSLGEFIDEQDMETIVRQTEILEDKIVSSRYWNSREKRTIKKDVFQDRNFMCIPILNNKNRQTERRVSPNILGFLYLESNMYIDNFTRKTYEMFKHWVNLVGIFLENHNLSTKYMLDKLTGAYNRQYFDNYIKNELEECQHFREQTFSLVMMDIDHFKQVNDTYGHAEGDILLQNFVHIVQENIRNYDMFARYGGEEFVLILKNMNAENALRISERIRKALEEKLKDPSGKSVTASMGIASFMEHGVWEDELIRRADMAMYYSKAGGRNRVTVWDEQLGDGKQFQIDSMTMANFRLDDHEAERLFVNGIGILRLDGGEQKCQDYLMEIVDYFKAEKLLISFFDDRGMWMVTSKSVGEVGDQEREQLNAKIVHEVVETHKSIFTIDWENISRRDELTGIPDWDSILCVPILRKGQVKGFLYMRSSFRTKEFALKDSLVLQFLTTIIGGLFQE